MVNEQQNWLIESVRYFRAMNFFAADIDLSDDELAQWIVAEEEAACREAGGTPVWERPEVERLWEHESPSGDAELDEYFERLARPRRDQ